MICKRIYIKLKINTCLNLSLNKCDEALIKGLPNTLLYKRHVRLTQQDSLQGKRLYSFTDCTSDVELNIYELFHIL